MVSNNSWKRSKKRPSNVIMIGKRPQKWELIMAKEVADTDITINMATISTAALITVDNIETRTFILTRFLMMERTLEVIPAKVLVPEFKDQQR